ncbi:helix-turn-helix transcriptional regulator [Saccharomonospora marina]|uniref:helix-turn-helix transcriptional regulator n=1 Tax=Saccharomonospora marina TaxID=632569 RepID=UPI0018DEE3CF|nr:helix-turn-helix domain-containing protein [Saccharomonospora marina]
MENSERMGPSPVRARPDSRPMSGQRGTVLEHLQRRAEPTTIAVLAGELDAHPNTVREHLDALVETGLAVRERARSGGRGRPAWTYSAAPDRAEPDPRVREYAGLATALAAHLTRTSARPAEEALEAGRAWGRELATERDDDSGSQASPARGRRRVLDLLDELGFDPKADARATTAALRRCPLLDAATRYPEVVCQVHLGIVRGAMEVFGGDEERTALLPFSEPGACRLRLMTRD